MNELDLFIFPDKDSSGTISYTMARNRQRPAPGSPLPQVHLPRNSRRWKLNYEIINAPNTNVQFKDDPFWAGEDCPCPPPQGVSSDQVIDIHKHNDSQASFVDKNNGRARRIVYQINLHENGTDHPFDPEVQNGGGTGNIYSYALLGSGLGAAAGYFASQSFNETAAASYTIAGALVGALGGFLLGRP